MLDYDNFQESEKKKKDVSFFWSQQAFMEIIIHLWILVYSSGN